MSVRKMALGFARILVAFVVLFSNFSEVAQAGNRILSHQINVSADIPPDLPDPIPPDPDAPPSVIPAPVPIGEVKMLQVQHVFELALLKYRSIFGDAALSGEPELKMEGDWAVSRQSVTGGASQLLLLAHRSPSGDWYVLPPDQVDSYRDWLHLLPETLVTTLEKAEIESGMLTTASTLANPSSKASESAATLTQLHFLPLLLNAGQPTVTPPQLGETWKQYVDPLYHYGLTIPGDWNVAAPAADAVYGAAVLLNYDSENIDPDVMPPGGLKVQIGVAPLVSGQTLHEWSLRWQALQYDLAMVNGYAMQMSAANADRVGAYDAVMYTISDGSYAPVLEWDMALNDQQVMVVNVTPADSTLLPLVKQIIGNVKYDPTYTFHPEVVAIAQKLSLMPQFSTTAFEPSAILATCPAGTFPGNEAPTTPISLDMPFKSGETWTVGGAGSFYGNGYHCNGNNDYYATDWNRPGDAGAAVLPVADGTISAAVTPTCPGTGYGCYVQIVHGSGVRTQYGHLNSVLRTSGSVNHGDQIGTVGTTGNSTGEHLHLSFWVNNGGYYSHCYNNGSTCPNGEGSLSPQSSKPSPMNTTNGAQTLSDGGSYTSNNSGGGGGTDTTAPDGRITSPSNGATVSSRTARIEGWGSDSGSGFDHAHFTANYNGSWHQISSDFGSSPYGFDWNMCDAGVPDGSIELGMDIWDKAGNGANSPGGTIRFNKSYNCSPPPTCSPNADQVSLYADPNFSGNCVTLGVGEYPSDSQLSPMGNDAASSIRVGSNVKAILFEHGSFGGVSEEFSADDSRLEDNSIGGDRVSSVKVQVRQQAPGAPGLQTPGNGAVIAENASIALGWSSTGNEYYGEVWGGPGGTLAFGWQGSASKNIGSQWAGYTYSWHVKARNSAGESGWSDAWTFTVRPGAPSNLAAQVVSSSQIDLNWSDNSGNEEGYRIYRNDQLIATVGSNVQSYQDTGLSCDTSYDYFVKAYRGDIESETSNGVDGTTSTCQPASCGPDAGLEPNNAAGQATSIAYGQTLQAAICPVGDADFFVFSGAAGDKVVVNIDARVNGSPLDSYLTLYDSDGQSVLATQDDENYLQRDSHLGYTLAHAGVYFVKVTEYAYSQNGGADYTYSIELHTDFTSPDSVAITFPAYDGWLSRAKQTVTASADDAQSGIARVDFYWHNGDWANSEWHWLGYDNVGSDGWSWDMSGLGEEAGVAFFVYAYDWVGNSTGASVWASGIDRTRPASSVLTLPALSDPTFLVKWSGTDSLSGVEKYDVQYRSGATGIWTNWMNGVTVSTASFTGQPNSVYQFRSRSYDAAGNVEGWPANDAADSATQTRTGLTDVIFRDDFEACNLAAWTAGETGSGELNASTTAAIVSRCGMRALIDDNIPIYVTDDRPTAEARYRMRFYFNPNSIAMASGDNHIISLGFEGVTMSVWRLDLRFYNGSYQLLAGLRDDASTWKLSAWQQISNAPHLIEIDWKAASAVGANNGAMTLWIDEVGRASLTGVDNDTLRVDRVRLGAVANLDAGTRGSYFFDQFESRRSTYIGPQKDVIFRDDFEACNLAAWTANVNDSGDLATSTAAAIVGNCGMRALIDDNTPIYATDDRPTAETRYRMRFYFDPNSITMANGENHIISLGYQGATTGVWRLDLRFYNGYYQLLAGVRDDSSTWLMSPWQRISNAPHLIEIDWKAAYATGANNGAMTLWIDEVVRANLTGIDNDTRRIDRVRIGAVGNIDSGTRGVYYFDQFLSRRQAYSGVTRSAVADLMAELDEVEPTIWDTGTEQLDAGSVLPLNPDLELNLSKTQPVEIFLPMIAH